MRALPAIIVISCLTLPASAQESRPSPDALAKENARLRQHIESLQRRIDTLELQLAAAQKPKETLKFSSTNSVGFLTEPLSQSELKSLIVRWDPSAANPPPAFTLPSLRTRPDLLSAPPSGIGTINAGKSR